MRSGDPLRLEALHVYWGFRHTAQIRGVKRVRIPHAKTRFREKRESA